MKQPFSIVYQITQECPFDCSICHRLYQPGRKPLSMERRKEMVVVLKSLGLKRLTITGGEPTILGENLYAFLRYIHDQEIHVSLSSNGYRLTPERIEELDQYLDQLLIPIRSFSEKEWRVDFGDTPNSGELYRNVMQLLEVIKKTGIFLEVSTVVHKRNIGTIHSLGSELAKVNSNIIWRVEEYYSNGYREDLRSSFELSSEEYQRVCESVERQFSDTFKQIRFVTKESRAQAPDIFIGPDGNLVKTSNYTYNQKVGNIFNAQVPELSSNRRPWENYKLVCRDWGWDNQLD